MSWIGVLGLFRTNCFVDFCHFFIPLPALEFFSYLPPVNRAIFVAVNPLVSISAGAKKASEEAGIFGLAHRQIIPQAFGCVNNYSDFFFGRQRGCLSGEARIFQHTAAWPHIVIAGDIDQFIHPIAIHQFRSRHALLAPAANHSSHY